MGDLKSFFRRYFLIHMPTEAVCTHVKKICVLGLERAGKTSLAKSLCGTKLDPEYSPTIGVTFHSLSHADFKILFWDCGGQTHFRMLWPAFLRGADGIIFVVDSVNPFSIAESLAMIEKMHEKMGIPFLIVLSKQDREDAINPEIIQTVFSTSSLWIVGASIYDRNSICNIIDNFLGKIGALEKS